jgi:hypothetical protein
MLWEDGGVAALIATSEAVAGWIEDESPTHERTTDIWHLTLDEVPALDE